MSVCVCVCVCVCEREREREREGIMAVAHAVERIALTREVAHLCMRP